jgi:hypothetical protein
MKGKKTELVNRTNSAAKTNGNEVGFLRLPNVLLVMLDIGPEQCARAWLRGEAFFGRYRNK